MPKYAALIYGPAETEGQGTPEEQQQVMVDYMEFGQKAGEAGVMVGGEALHDTNSATTVPVARSHRTPTPAAGRRSNHEGTAASSLLPLDMSKRLMAALRTKKS